MTADELAHFVRATERHFGLRGDDRPGAMAELGVRRAAARDESMARYLARLDAGDPEELRVLATELTVGETYFFRHAEQFHAFADVALSERLAARGRINVLSAGCSSGEEPYTLAMLVRERVVETNTVAIHAIDLDPSALERAARGRYSRWALRATPPELEQRWFQKAGREVVLAPSLRSQVVFEEANIAADGPIWAPASWDVVFCRNVLMYFSDARLQAAIARISRALVPGGYLFLGHAETLRDRSDDFELCHTHGTFYYRRRPATAVRHVATTAPVVASPAANAGWYDDIRAATERLHAIIDGALAAVPPPVASEPPAAGSAIRANAGSAVEPPNAAPAIESAVVSAPAAPAIESAVVVPAPAAAIDSAVGASTPAALVAIEPALVEVRELYAQERFAEALARLDELPRVLAAHRTAVLLRALVLTHAGRITDAETTCRELLDAEPANADGHYLLALCRDSAGDPAGAAAHARRASELDPSFAMSRVQLGLLARRAGDREAATRELARAIVLLEREDETRLALFGGGFNRQALVALCRAELAASGRTALVDGTETGRSR